MKRYTIPWLLLLLTLAACKKETELDKLPDATQKGKNTAGFLLDGKAWLPEASNLIGTGGAVSASWQRTVAGRSLRIGFSRDNDDTTLQFYLPNVRQAGNFQLNQAVGLPLGMRNPDYGLFIMARNQ